MILQKMNFDKNDYHKIVDLKDQLITSGESHQFYRTFNTVEKITFNPTAYEFSFPHNDHEKYDERVFVTLRLWEKEEKGQISFTTPSIDAFRNSESLIKKLIGEPTKEIKSGISTIVDLG